MMSTRGTQHACFQQRSLSQILRSLRISNQMDLPVNGPAQSDLLADAEVPRG